MYIKSNYFTKIFLIIFFTIFNYNSYSQMSGGLYGLNKNRNRLKEAQFEMENLEKMYRFKKEIEERELNAKKYVLDIDESISDEIRNYRDDFTTDEYSSLLGLKLRLWKNIKKSISIYGNYREYLESNLDQVKRYRKIMFDRISEYRFNVDEVEQQAEVISKPVTIKNVESSQPEDNIDFGNEYDDIIRNFFNAQNERDFKIIYPFFSSNVKNAWGVKNPKYSLLKKTYQKIWDSYFYSKSTVKDIVRLSKNTYYSYNEFYYYSDEEKAYVTDKKTVRIIFNNNGKIIEISN